MTYKMEPDGECTEPYAQRYSEKYEEEYDDQLYHQYQHDQYEGDSYVELAAEPNNRRGRGGSSYPHYSSSESCASSYKKYQNKYDQYMDKYVMSSNSSQHGGGASTLGGSSQYGMSLVKDPPTSYAEEQAIQEEHALVKWDPSAVNREGANSFLTEEPYDEDEFQIEGGENSESESSDYDEDEDICEETYREMRPKQYDEEERPAVHETALQVRGRDPDTDHDGDSRPRQRDAEPDIEVQGGHEVHHRELVLRNNSASNEGSNGSSITSANKFESYDKLYEQEFGDPQNQQLALITSASARPPPKYNGYQHYFITVREEHRFLVLYTFLKRNTDHKVIIYFATTKSTQYYSKLLERLKFDARAIHNGQSREKFLDSFFEFSKQESGILCLPDFQGNEFAIPPTVDWIVQFEPPADPSEYIFRVGRISSEVEHASGRALLFLTPKQFGFLSYYKAAEVKIYEYELSKISNVQKNYERLIKKDSKLRRSAREAYNAYLMNYAQHDYRDVYNVHELNKDLVVKVFGFSRPPSSRRGSDDGESSDKGEDLKNSMEKRRQERLWKPDKSRKDCWLKGEKSWRYADRHADIMKPNPRARDSADYKPSTIRTR